MRTKEMVREEIRVLRCAGDAYIGPGGLGGGLCWALTYGVTGSAEDSAARHALRQEIYSEMNRSFCPAYLEPSPWDPGGVDMRLNLLSDWIERLEYELEEMEAA